MDRANLRSLLIDMVPPHLGPLCHKLFALQLRRYVYFYIIPQNRCSRCRDGEMPWERRRLRRSASQRVPHIPKPQIQTHIAIGKSK